MINRNIIQSWKRRFRAEAPELERAFVYAYIKEKKLDITECAVLTRFLKDFREKETEPAGEAVFREGCIQGLDDLITAFELLLDEKDKKNKGMVYTPQAIKEYILERVIVQDFPPRVIDPACGCGSFLVTAARRMKRRYGLTYRELCSGYLYGVDIDRHSIEKAVVLLNLLALEEGEEPVEGQTGLITGNSLEVLRRRRYMGGFDAVIGNPPYVRARNIDDGLKESLRRWTVVSGNTDLYIPFYQLGIRLLNENGKLGFISPNTFLQSVNGRKLRTFLVGLNRDIRILDFRASQTFQDITHYTCVCIVDKEQKSNSIRYALSGSGSLLQNDFTEYPMDSYLEDAEWRFGSLGIDRVIGKIEHQESRLEDYRIRNGLATLKNDLFFFTPLRQDREYFYREYKGRLYPIEKEVCIPVAKPNILRNEADLESKMEQAVFPYCRRDGKQELLEETAFRERYPRAYAFLEEYKEELLARDKGKGGSYPAWYAYGRTQGMHNQGKKLLIPYMAERGVAVLSEEEELLFYCGYAVFSEDTDTLRILKKLIESRVFWYYISNTSKPYSKGYMALAKNYIRNFGIPGLSGEQRQTLLALEPGEECEEFVAGLYGLRPEELEG